MDEFDQHTLTTQRELFVALGVYEHDVVAGGTGTNTARSEPHTALRQPLDRSLEVIDPQSEMVESRIVDPGTRRRVEGLHEIDLDCVRSRTEAKDVLLHILRLARVVAHLLDTEGVDPQTTERSEVEAADGDLLQTEDTERTIAAHRSHPTDPVTAEASLPHQGQEYARKQAFKGIMSTDDLIDDTEHFYLGPFSDNDADGNLHYESSDLTTHGVIVGMTGSGKTGLGMVMLEEALLDGIPCLIIDPKGDMGNLSMVSATFDAADFAPWVTEGLDPAAAAAQWKDGTARSGIDGDRMAALAAVETTIYTPGSSAGVSLNVIGDLRAPADMSDVESVRDEIDGLVQGLLGLVGVRSDPLSGREHVLLANLVNHAWTNAESLDLAGLIGRIQAPPMRKLGVIDLDTFFPADDRTALAMKLNGLLASPSFAAWADGEPLDIESMLVTADGRPRAAVVSIAHLSDDERQFVVTLVLSKLVTWMRSQSGSPKLRALVYMDEVFGFVPPTASPPAKKPILTVLKQARAFGVGMVLSTQNPVDLDYKAISNAGTWLIGRLQTERDRDRLLDGMRSAGGTVDVSALADTIGNLDKREFVLHSTRSSRPRRFSTRWAMSYMTGPLTREQIAGLMADRRAVTSTPASATSADTAPPEAVELADDESAVAPDVADGIPVAYLDPAAGWATAAGATIGGGRLQAAIAARVHLLFDDTKGDLRHEAAWEAIIVPLGTDIDGADFVAVDYDDRDLRPTPPEGAIYVLPQAKIHTKTFFSNAQRALKDQLYRSASLSLFRNDALKLYSRVDEREHDFAERCRIEADTRLDEEADELRAAMQRKQERVQAAVAKAEDRLRELEADASDRKRSEVLSGAVDIIGGLFGGRRSARSILGGVRRASDKRRTTANASNRVESAKNRLDEKIDELEDLADALVESLEAAADAWDEAAEAIEPFEVRLEKTDITVEDFTLVWVPTSR